MGYRITSVLFTFLFLYVGGASAQAPRCDEVFTSSSLPASIFTPSKTSSQTSGLILPAGFSRDRYVQLAPHVAGVLLGSANGVLLAATHGQHILIAADVAKWLPFFNETANALSTATGQRWVYSGKQKKVIDGIALGALAGQALHVGVEKGSLAGALTLGASIGLSYWFPNKYFEPIMTKIPKLVPEKFRNAARNPISMGLIGIGLIDVLEHVLEYAQALAQAIPHYFSLNTTATGLHRANRALASVPAVSLEHALALWILDASLPDSSDRNARMQELMYLSGADLSGAFFSESAAFERPAKALNSSVRETLRQKFNSPVMAQILTRSEREAVLNRL
jgi:hypothetical protein